MKTRFVDQFPIIDLIPNGENPRFINKKKFKELVKSIREFPEMLKIRPVVADENGLILAGNMRFEAAKYLKFRTIPAMIVSEITMKKQREFAIKDNVSFGFWDFEELSNNWEVEELLNWGMKIPDFEQPGSFNEDDKEAELDLKNNFIKIKFFPEHIKEAKKILQFWEERGVYVGGFLIEQLKQFDENSF
jgi:hypothetical protein